MATTDPLGTWEEIGTVTPNFYQWEPINIPINERNNLIRLTYLGDFSQTNKIRSSLGYLRIKWDTNPPVYSNWTRFFPKLEREILEIYVPSEMLVVSEAVDRFIEITKYPYKSYRQVELDPPWSVSVEVYLDVSLAPFLDAFPNQGNLSRRPRIEDILQLQQNLLYFLFL